MDLAATYRAALAGLRYVEHQRATGRRFGPDADARWKAIQGALTTADRIDLLIRDADAQWPGAFGPRTVFNFDSVAEDEPFGPPWPGLRPVDAEELWREALKEGAPSTPREALTRMASAWGLGLAPTSPGAVAPADKLVAVGPSAIAALIEAFVGAANLDWVAQVACVATPPAHRQLAAFAGAVLSVNRRPVLLGAGESPTARLAGRRLVTSPDAHPDDLAHAKGLVNA